MNFTKRFTIAIATGAVLLNAIAPATYAATSLTVSGNGSNSDSSVNANANNNSNVSQNNNANVNNNIDVSANTGNNQTNGNVGGSVMQHTGDAKSDVNVSTAANTNKAAVSNCCNNDADVKVSGNGSRSDNNVTLNQNNNSNVGQSNNANINNNVKVGANTGDNKANDNVGGPVSVTTGSADSTVKVMNAANANSATVGAGNGNGNGGKVSAWVTGNGSNSDNTVNLGLNSNTNLSQNNSAAVNNNVDVQGKTGHNKANDNVGGDVTVQTGATDSTVGVDNMVNFNGADVDACGCVSDLDAKIAGNGSRSDNAIDYDANNNVNAGQNNNANVGNNAKVNGATGSNKMNDNVGYDGSDPSVTTGNSGSTVNAHTASNSNFFGHNFDLGWDWDSFLNWMGL